MKALEIHGEKELLHHDKKLTVKNIKTGKEVKSTSLTGKPGNRKNSNKKSEGTILLPIPSNISDTNSVKYDSSSLNSIAGAAVGGVMDIMQSPEDAKSFGDGINRLKQAGKGAYDNLVAASGGLDGIYKDLLPDFLHQRQLVLPILTLHLNKFWQDLKVRF